MSTKEVNFSSFSFIKKQWTISLAAAYMGVYKQLIAQTNLAPFNTYVAVIDDYTFRSKIVTIQGISGAQCWNNNINELRFKTTRTSVANARLYVADMWPLKVLTDKNLIKVRTLRRLIQTKNKSTGLININ